MEEFKKIEKEVTEYKFSGVFFENFRGYFLKILGDFANSKIMGGIFGGNFSISGAFRGFRGEVATLYNADVSHR